VQQKFATKQRGGTSTLKLDEPVQVKRACERILEAAGLRGLDRSRSWQQKREVGQACCRWISQSRRSASARGAQEQPGLHGLEWDRQLCDKMGRCNEYAADG